MDIEDIINAPLVLINFKLNPKKKRNRAKMSSDEKTDEKKSFRWCE
jgi:hypothetical protein